MSFARPDSDTPFRILVLGDFGARAVTGRPIQIDRDNFDRVMGRLEVQLDLPGAGALRFKELDDFHPDRLFQSLDVFHGLRDLRAKVEDPTTFERTASELMSAREAAPPKKAPAAPQASVFLSGNLLEDIVESSESGGSAAAPARRLDPLQKYVQAIVAPHISPRPDPKQAEMLGQVDEAIADAMRTLLHERRFQALEAAWRGLDFLVHNTETTNDLKIYVMHLPRKTLEGELLPASDLRRTAFYRTLVEETVGTPGGQPWALVAANYTFGPATGDVELLGRLALLAAAAGSPVIAHGDAALLGGPQELATWKQLVKIPETRYVGLAMPRFLLRLPYGKETDPAERFPFEEIKGEPKHRDYVWGNPAFACAFLIAAAFSENGWEMRPGDALDISGLPSHVYRKDGESVMKPCAEVVMTESEATALMDRGLIPVLSIKNSDRVHVAGFRSITGSALPGLWSAES